MKSVLAKNGIGFMLAATLFVMSLFASGCVSRRYGYGYGPGYYGPRYHDNDHDNDRGRDRHHDHDRDGYRYR